MKLPSSRGVQGVVTEVLHAQGFAVLERAGGADRMQAPEQLPEAVQLIEIARLRRPATTTGGTG
jgi:hypothetical protein